MRFTTMTAKFPGWCKRCKGQFPAGTRIRYGGRGLTYHMADDCPASQNADSGAGAVRLEAATARNMGQTPGSGYDGSGDGYAARRRYNARRRAPVVPMFDAVDNDQEYAADMAMMADSGTATRDFPVTLPAGSVDANGDAIPDPSMPLPKGGYPTKKLSLMEMAAALDSTEAYEDRGARAIRLRQDD